MSRKKRKESGHGPRTWEANSQRIERSARARVELVFRIFTPMNMQMQSYPYEIELGDLIDEASIPLPNHKLGT
jgi:hypothetical protein